MSVCWEQRSRPILASIDTSPSSAPPASLASAPTALPSFTQHAVSTQQRHSSTHSCRHSSRVDYCNALLAGAPKVTTDKLQRLQRVMNAAARVITGTHKFDRGLSRILHTVTELQWLDVPERVMYKLEALHHGARCLHGQAPLGRPLPTSLRRRFSAASQVRQSTFPGPSATPVANVRPTGFLCCWPVGLELIA